MRYLAWTLWLILFLVLFAFAVSNTASAELHLLGGMSWQAPLIALLLAFFLAGVAFGLIAMLPSWFRQRLQIRRLRKQIAANDAVTAETPRRTTVSPDAIQSVAQGARTTS